MKLKPKETIADYFMGVEDPRIERTKRHQLIDVITIAICAVICGADSWVAIETYGHAKQEWLKRFLELSNGIPSHDTFAQSSPGEASPGRLCKNIFLNRSTKFSRMFCVMDEISCT